MNPKRMLLGICLIVFLAGCNLNVLPLGPTATPSLTPTPSQTLTPTPSPTPTASPTPLPEVRVENAGQAYFEGDFTRARGEYQLALAGAADGETRAAALWGLGQVEYADDNPSQALDYLRQLITDFPSTKKAPEAFFVLGEIYASLDRYSEAIDAYNHYLGLRPGVIDYYVQVRRGDVFAAAGNYPEAIAAYQAALTAPHLGDDTALKTKIAQAYNSSGDPGTALTLLDSLDASTTNGYVKAQMDLLEGQIYVAQGKTDLGYQKYLDAVNNYPLAYDSYTGLVVLVNAGVPVDDFNRGLVDYYAGQYLVQVDQYAGQYGYALDAFNRYVNAHPDNDGTVRYYRALTLEGLGEYQQAVDELTYFIDTYTANKHWEAAWSEKADVQWIHLDQPEAAAQTLLDFVAAAPNSQFAPDSLFTAGRDYERAGRLEDAARVWEGIVRSYPGSIDAPQGLFFAAITNYRLGKYDQALLDMQQNVLLVTDPEDKAAAYFWIGKTQQKKGDAAAAQTAWQQAAGLDPASYYSLRAGDMLFNRPIFAPPAAYNLSYDLAAERPDAEAWVRVKFNLPPDTDLSSPGTLLSDPRLVRGTELWNLGLLDEARLEFEDLRNSRSEDPADTYRLANYLLNLGVYRSAINAIEDLLGMAGMHTLTQMQAAPAYFNHIRFGLYYQDLVLPAAQTNGFNPLLLFAVMRQESYFEGFVRSGQDARGLMQIIPSTGQSIADNMGWPPNYTSQDLYRPLVSIDLGAHYLLANQMLLNGDLVAALAAYNGGPVNAQVWQQLAGSDDDLLLETVRIQETRNYIRSIYEYYAMYRFLYGTNP